MYMPKIDPPVCIPNETPNPRKVTNNPRGSRLGAMFTLRLSVRARMTRQKIAVATNSVKKEATGFT